MEVGEVDPVSEVHSRFSKQIEALVPWEEDEKRETLCPETKNIAVLGVFEFVLSVSIAVATEIGIQAENPSNIRLEFLLLLASFGIFLGIKDLFFSLKVQDDSVTQNQLQQILPRVEGVIKDWVLEIIEICPEKEGISEQIGIVKDYFYRRKLHVVFDVVKRRNRIIGAYLDDGGQRI